MDLDIHSLTSTFGLSPSEAEVFEYLLQYGQIKAVELRKNLHLDRAPFYRTLSSLEAKNLLVVTGTLRKQSVELQTIGSIEETLRSKKIEIESAEKSLSMLAANMKELRDSRYHRDNVEIFSGNDAYLHSMQAVLNGGGKVLRDITPQSDMLYDMAGGKMNYAKVVNQIKAERLKKNIDIRILFDRNANNIDQISLSNPQTLKESRQFSGDLGLDCYLNMCGSRSLFYTKDAKDSWGIIIHDPLIAKLLSSMFDVIWNISKSI